MSMQRLERLKEHYKYEDWWGTNALGENLFIWRFFLSGSQFSGWQVSEIETREVTGQPTSIKAIWHRPQNTTEELIRVDAFECASRTAAHEFLMRLLAESQTLVVRQQQRVIGDVAFIGPEDKGILFVRANLVFLVRNAGRVLVPITELARQLDEEIVSHPEPTDTTVVPEIQRFFSPATVFQVDASIPLEVEASDPLERPLWYKFFSRTGEILLEEGHLVYRPISDGPQTVTVYAINVNQGAASEDLQFAAQ